MRWEDDKFNTDCGQSRRSRGIKSKSCNAKIIVKRISVRSGYHQFVEVPSPISPSVSPLLRTVSTRGCEGEETIPVILLIVHQLEGTSYQEINSEEDGRFRIIQEFRKIAKIKSKDISQFIYLSLNRTYSTVFVHKSSHLTLHRREEEEDKPLLQFGKIQMSTCRLASLSGTNQGRGGDVNLVFALQLTGMQFRWSLIRSCSRNKWH